MRLPPAGATTAPWLPGKRPQGTQCHSRPPTPARAGGREAAALAAGSSGDLGTDVPPATGAPAAQPFPAPATNTLRLTGSCPKEKQTALTRLEATEENEKDTADRKKKAAH